MQVCDHCMLGAALQLEALVLSSDVYVRCHSKDPCHVESLLGVLSL